MNLVDKYLETESELVKIKKLMVFEFANYVHDNFKITLSIEDSSFVIQDNDLKITSLIDFLIDDFSEYHYHVKVLFELSECVSRRKITNCDLHSYYFLNHIDIF